MESKRDPDIRDANKAKGRTFRVKLRDLVSDPAVLNRGIFQGETISKLSTRGERDREVRSEIRRKFACSLIRRALPELSRAR